MAEFEGKHPNYWFIWVWLAVLTVVEVLIARTDLNKKAMILVLCVFAVAKALLVALYFMHLRYEWARGRIIYLLACAPFLLVLVITFGLLPDIGGIARFLPF